MLIIGIAGGSGSGKTTVVRRIVERLPADQVVVIPQDNYYRDNSHLPLEERRMLNYDHPSAIEFNLLIEHLKKIKKGESIEMPLYSYITHARLPETISISPKSVIIVEGIMLFVEEKLRKLLDIKVFVHADSDDRLMRRIRRDTAERGRDLSETLNQYAETVQPMHLQFIEPTKRYADIILPMGGQNDVAIDMLVARINMKLQQDH
ncbi:MAG: uridine kinase [Sphingobacteriales bacterium]|nr:uridine kinase [Sphingobacteriales bacterium]